MEKIAEVSFQSRKTEKSYFHIQQEYPSIVKKCNDATKLILDFSHSEINQQTVERVVKDLFYMPIIEVDEEGRPFKHKYFELKSVYLNVLGSQITNVDFISSFFLYHNMIEITLDCAFSDIAISFLKVSKTTQRIKKVICKDYFEKNYGLYTLISNAFFTDNIQEWIGIEEFIEVLDVQISYQTYDLILEKLSQCTLLIQLKCEFISLSNVKSQMKAFTSTLSKKCKFLENLEIVTYFDSLLPPISMENFPVECKLTVFQKCLNIKSIPLSTIYRKVFSFIQLDNVFKIEGIVEYQERKLFLNLSQRILTSCKDNLEEAQEGEEDEIKELIKFLSKSTQGLESINIEFSNLQLLSKENWVKILKLLCAQKTLKSVKIYGTNSSQQMTALFQAKLIKSGKEFASINLQEFKNGQLTFRVHQINDAVLKKLLEQNCLRLGASKISKIKIESDIVMGTIQLFSNYLKNINKILESFSVTILSKSCDLTALFPTIVRDRYKIEVSAEKFEFRQVGDFNLDHFSFKSDYDSVQMHFEMMYNYQRYLFDMREVICGYQLNLYQKILSPIRYYNSLASHFPYDQIINKVDFFCQLRQAHITFTQKNLLTFQIYTFFEIIGPYLPLNPYMVVTDLYYD